MNKLPDLRLLKTFSTVASTRSMSQTARLLGYVPSAVSQQITALERSLAVELFVRRPGTPLMLTAEGRSLLQAANSLFAATIEFQEIAERISNRDLIELQIGAYATAADHLFPPLLRSLQAEAKTTSIRLVDVETRPGLPLLLDGDLDLLIAHRYLPEEPPAKSSDLTVTTLGREPLLVVSAAAGTDRPMDLTDCLDRDWTAGNPTTPDGRLLRRWGSEAGFAPGVRYETSDCATQMSLVANGLALALVPASVVAAWRDTERPVVPVRLPKGVAPPTREVMAVTRSRYGAPIIDTIVGELQKTLLEIIS